MSRPAVQQARFEQSVFVFGRFRNRFCACRCIGQRGGKSGRVCGGAKVLNRKVVLFERLLVAVHRCVGAPQVVKDKSQSGGIFRRGCALASTSELFERFFTLSLSDL